MFVEYTKQFFQHLENIKIIQISFCNICIKTVVAYIEKRLF